MTGVEVKTDRGKDKLRGRYGGSLQREMASDLTTD